MSFPSAVTFLEEGLEAEDALLQAIQKDTPEGYAYVQALVEVRRNRVQDVLAFMRDRVKACAESILRFEWLPTGGVKVDVAPDSKLGQQVMRLLGTDVARATLQKHFGMYFGLANCCGGQSGETQEEVKTTAEQQIAWQHSIDC